MNQIVPEGFTPVQTPFAIPEGFTPVSEPQPIQVPSRRSFGVNPPIARGNVFIPETPRMGESEYMRHIQGMVGLEDVPEALQENYQDFYRRFNKSTRSPTAKLNLAKELFGPDTEIIHPEPVGENEWKMPNGETYKMQLPDNMQDIVRTKEGKLFPLDKPGLDMQDWNALITEGQLLFPELAGAVIGSAVGPGGTIGVGILAGTTARYLQLKDERHLDPDMEDSDLFVTALMDFTAPAAAFGLAGPAFRETTRRMLASPVGRDLAKSLGFTLDDFDRGMRRHLEKTPDVKPSVGTIVQESAMDSGDRSMANIGSSLRSTQNYLGRTTGMREFAEENISYENIADDIVKTIFDDTGEKLTRDQVNEIVRKGLIENDAEYFLKNKSARKAYDSAIAGINAEKKQKLKVFSQQKTADIKKQNQRLLKIQDEYKLRTGQEKDMLDASVDALEKDLDVALSKIESRAAENPVGFVNNMEKYYREAKYETRKAFGQVYDELGNRAGNPKIETKGIFKEVKVLSKARQEEMLDVLPTADDRIMKALLSKNNKDVSSISLQDLSKTISEVKAARRTALASGEKQVLARDLKQIVDVLEGARDTKLKSIDPKIAQQWKKHDRRYAKMVENTNRGQLDTLVRTIKTAQGKTRENAISALLSSPKEVSNVMNMIRHPLYKGFGSTDMFKDLINKKYIDDVVGARNKPEAHDRFMREYGSQIRNIYGKNVPIKTHRKMMETIQKQETKVLKAKEDIENIFDADIRRAKAERDIEVEKIRGRPEDITETATEQRQLEQVKRGDVKRDIAVEQALDPLTNIPKGSVYKKATESPESMKQVIDIINKSYEPSDAARHLET